MKLVVQAKKNCVCNKRSLCAVPRTAACADSKTRGDQWARKASVSKNLGVFLAEMQIAKIMEKGFRDFFFKKMFMNRSICNKAVFGNNAQHGTVT